MTKRCSRTTCFVHDGETCAAGEMNPNDCEFFKNSVYAKSVNYLEKNMIVTCDGKCNKAWGIASRPKIQLSDDVDDIAHLSDEELGEAPSDPGTYEGGHAKPDSPMQMNKWCLRECERSVCVSEGENIDLPDFSKRRLNQPWKHTEN